MSLEQFLGKNLATCPAFLPELWEVFPSLQCAGYVYFSPVSGRIDGYPYLSLVREHKSSFSPHTSSWAGEKHSCFVSMAGTSPPTLASTVTGFAGYRSPHPWPWFLV